MKEVYYKFNDLKGKYVKKLAVMCMATAMWANASDMEIDTPVSSSLPADVWKKVLPLISVDSDENSVRGSNARDIVAFSRISKMTYDHYQKLRSFYWEKCSFYIDDDLKNANAKDVSLLFNHIKTKSNVLSFDRLYVENNQTRHPNCITLFKCLKSSDSSSLYVFFPCDEFTQRNFLTHGTEGEFQDNVMSLVGMLNNNKTMKRYGFINCGLSGVGVGNYTAILAALFSLDHLIGLDLRMNAIADEHLRPVINILAENKSIKAIDLRGNWISSDKGLNLLSGVLQVNKAIVLLKLSEFRINNTRETSTFENQLSKINTLLKRNLDILEKESKEKSQAS